MRTIGDRLRQAREEKFSTSEDAAEAFGFNANTLRSNENGNKDFSVPAAIRYAQAFGINLDWLLRGLGPMRPGQKQLIKVVGVVGHGAAVHTIAEGTLAPIEPPYGVPEDAKAYVVRGNSEYPAVRDGMTLIVLPITDLSEVSGKRALVTLDDGQRLLKEVIEGSQPGLFTLYSHNAPPIVDARISDVELLLCSVEPYQVIKS